MKVKNVYVIAGPNGSGKTTFAKKFLPFYAKCYRFINADLIAQGLSPFSPQVAAIKAGRLVLEQIKDLANANLDFAFETTLAGRYFVKLFGELKRKKYRLHLFYLWLPTPELAIARIKDRVAEGGHAVPAADVRRRFYRGIYNFFRFYRVLFDSWILFDNSGSEPKVIAEGKKDRVIIRDEKLFENILRRE